MSVSSERFCMLSMNECQEIREENLKVRYTQAESFVYPEHPIYLKLPKFRFHSTARQLSVQFHCDFGSVYKGSLVQKYRRCWYPLFTRTHTPQSMIFAWFAALFSIGVHPVRLNRLPCKSRKSSWLRSQSRKEINFVSCKALEWSVPSGTLIESNTTGRKIYSLSTVCALVKRGYLQKIKQPLKMLMSCSKLLSFRMRLRYQKLLSETEFQKRFLTP